MNNKKRLVKFWRYSSHASRIVGLRWVLQSTFLALPGLEGFYPQGDSCWQHYQVDWNSGWVSPRPVFCLLSKADAQTITSGEDSACLQESHRFLPQDTSPLTPHVLIMLPAPVGLATALSVCVCVWRALSQGSYNMWEETGLWPSVAFWLQ